MRIRESFFGREDHALSGRLMAELPGILNWALDGLARLRARGRFLQPASSDEAMQELEDLGSPIKAFIRERCVIGPAHQVLPNHLYEAWTGWCKNTGRDHPGTLQAFARDLRAAVPHLKTRNVRQHTGRQRIYEGIGLIP
jgi:putative DNA primase/helicase